MFEFFNKYAISSKWVGGAQGFIRSLNRIAGCFASSEGGSFPLLAGGAEVSQNVFRT